MKVGIVVPQGWLGEYHAWPYDQAWAKSLEIAGRADRLGFDSVWAFDHFQTTPAPMEELTFEAFSTLAAIAAVTERAQLGPLVACAGYRNAALLAKMIGTLDVISNGRFVAGVGAGWKRDEYVAYGYGFPPLRERMEVLRDTLEILTRLLGANVGDYAGRHASIYDAYNVPRGIQVRVPIMVGGNGPNVTWRLAARHADELNLDGLTPAEVAKAMPIVRARCAEIGRDPDSLSVSIHCWWESLSATGQQRVDLIGEYARLGISRVIGMIRESVESDDALAQWADDARAAGAELEPSTAIGA